MKHLLFMLLAVIGLSAFSQERMEKEEIIRISEDYFFDSTLRKEADPLTRPLAPPKKAPSAVEFSGGFPKNAVVEEATGTWCGWCPRGIVMCEYIREHYSDRIIPIAVHQGDEMQIDQYNDFIYQYVYYYPSAFVDRREEMVVDTQAADQLYNQIKDQMTYARVNVTAYRDNNTVVIDSETEFAATVNSEHRLAFVLVEDKVGPYIQSNFCSGIEGLGFWSTAGSSVRWYFNDVARNIKTFDGITGSLPITPVPGKKYRYSATMDLSNVTSPTFKVIALIIDCQSGIIVNAGQFCVGAQEGVVLDRRGLNIPVGDTAQLTAYLDGSPLDENSCVWSSSDDGVAAVDSHGVVEGVSPGNATITVSCDAGSAQCQVNVTLEGSIWEINGIQYKISNDNTCMVTYPKENEQYLMDKIVIPAQIEVLGRNFKVTGLDFYAPLHKGVFDDSPNLEEIELPDNITYIPPLTFCCCKKLSKFTSPASIEIIDSYAFDQCTTLQHLELNEGLEVLWNYSCASCHSLKYIVIPSTMKKIGREVCAGAHPYVIQSKSVTPPIIYGDFFNTVEFSKDYEECALVVPERCINAYIEDEYWGRFEMIVPDWVVLNRYKLKMNLGDEFKMDVVNKDGATVIWSCDNTDIVSLDADGNVTALAYGEATITARCKGKSASCKVIVSIENLIEKSGDLWYEIREDNTCVVIKNQSSDQPYDVEKVTIPSEIEVEGQLVKVIEIENKAFEYCESLKEITFPATMRKIGESSFNVCRNLSKIVFNEGLEEIGTWCFGSCNSLKHITLPSTLKKIGRSAFIAAPLSRIVSKAPAPPALDGELLIGSDSTDYSDCFLIVPPASLDAYEEAEFWKLFEYIYPDDVILNTYKIKLNIGNEFKLEAENSDGDPVTWSCDNSSVAIVDTDGKVTALSLGEAVVTATCRGKTASCKVIVSYEGLIVNYGDLWYEIKENSTCAVIKKQSSYYNYDMEKVTVPSEIEFEGRLFAVTEIANHAFSWCSSLNEITFPNSIRKIGDQSFYNCKGLKEIILNEGLENIESAAFWNCDGLETIIFPSTLKTIDAVVLENVNPTMIICKATTPPTLRYPLLHNPSDTYSICVLMVPDGCTGAYKEADFWNWFDKIEPMGIVMESIRLDTGVLKLGIGDTYQFVATVLPADTSDKELEWWSDDDKVAIVDQNGFVTMTGEGSTAVHVRSAKWKHVKATCLLDVSAGIAGIIADDEPCDIYTTMGHLLKKSIPVSETDKLPRGIYIIRQGGKSIKILR